MINIWCSPPIPCVHMYCLSWLLCRQSNTCNSDQASTFQIRVSSPISMFHPIEMLLALMMLSPWAYEQILLAYSALRTDVDSSALSTLLCSERCKSFEIAQAVARTKTCKSCHLHMVNANRVKLHWKHFCLLNRCSTAPCTGLSA